MIWYSHSADLSTVDTYGGFCSNLHVRHHQNTRTVFIPLKLFPRFMESLPKHSEDVLVTFCGPAPYYDTLLLFPSSSQVYISLAFVTSNFEICTFSQLVLSIYQESQQSFVWRIVCNVNQMGPSFECRSAWPCWVWQTASLSCYCWKSGLQDSIRSDSSWPYTK